MNVRVSIVVASLAGLLLAAACSKSSPAVADGGAAGRCR